MAKKPAKGKRRGPEPERLKIDLPPEEAVRRMLAPVDEKHEKVWSGGDSDPRPATSKARTAT